MGMHRAQGLGRGRDAQCCFQRLRLRVSRIRVMLDEEC